jgi:hypothetical protein
MKDLSALRTSFPFFAQRQDFAFSSIPATPGGGGVVLMWRKPVLPS